MTSNTFILQICPGHVLHVRHWSKGFTNVTHLVFITPYENSTIIIHHFPSEEIEAQGLNVIIKHLIMLLLNTIFTSW